MTEAPIQTISHHPDRKTMAQTANAEFNQLNESSRSPGVSFPSNFEQWNVKVKKKKSELECANKATLQGHEKKCI